MSYDKSPDRNRRSAKEWDAVHTWANNPKPEIGDVVYVHNTDSILHGLPATVVEIDSLAAQLDFGSEIGIPCLGTTQRVWRMPLGELKFTAPKNLNRKWDFK